MGARQRWDEAVWANGSSSEEIEPHVSLFGPNDGSFHVQFCGNLQLEHS